MDRQRVWPQVLLPEQQREPLRARWVLESVPEFARGSRVLEWA